IYRGFKDKRYTTYLSIAICEIAIVGIISTFAIKVIVLGGVIGGESIWIVLIIGILSIVHKRLRSPINLNQRRKYRNPRGKYST
ncbi:MAG: hypothetical protein RR515_02755, partial [Clostridium sp.]